MSDQNDSDRLEPTQPPETAVPPEAAPQPDASGQPASALPPASSPRPIVAQVVTATAASTPFPTKAVLLGLAVVAVVAALWATSGRKPQSQPSGESTGPNRANQSAWKEELLPIAMDKFNRLEEFVEAEMLNQAIDQFDQWAQGQRPLTGWQVDPLVTEHPRLMSAVPEMAELDKLSFSRLDIMALQEAVLMRDVSNWARGEQVDDLERAKQLFDWTVRNVQLFDPRSQAIQQRPLETLLLGSGNLIDRAWVFILLCRQQGLDAVMLAVYDPKDSSKRQIVQWAPAVLLGKNLYPFITDMGVPIPAPGGVKRNDAGQLDIQPATVAQLAADDSLLRQLDIDPAHPYPVKASDLKQVVALIEASPAYLTQRLKMVESRLAGKEKVVLSTSPSAVAARLKECPQVAVARLWDIPYQMVLQRIQPNTAAAVARWQQVSMAPFFVGRSPWLMKGRILHLKGKLSGEPNAAEMYQQARPSDRELDAADMQPGLRTLYGMAKTNASYWLGLVAMEQGKYDPAAIDYFAKRTLEANPAGPWTYGAKYNLGRAYESLGQTDKAIRWYESDLNSPCLFGNLYRSRLLGSKTAHLPSALSPDAASTPSGQPAAKPGEKPATKAPEKPAVAPDAKSANRSNDKSPAASAKPDSPATKTKTSDSPSDKKTP